MQDTRPRKPSGDLASQKNAGHRRPRVDAERLKLVRRHTSGMHALAGIDVVVGSKGVGRHAHIIAGPAKGGRALRDWLWMLSEGKGLRSSELAALLLHSAQAAFAGRLVFFGSHFDVVLRETARTVIGEE